MDIFNEYLWVNDMDI